MIDLARRIVDRRETSVNRKLNVNSSLVEKATVRFIEESHARIRLRVPKYETDYNENEIPSDIVTILGVNTTYRFVFRLLERVTDMSKTEVSKHIRSSTSVGDSIENGFLDVSVQIAENKIVSQKEFYSSL